MARRVNTKFVIILSSVLLLVALAALLILGSNWLNARDPVWLMNKAKQAEQAKNFPAALQYYGMAAQRLSRTHESTAAETFYHAGVIAMNLSSVEPDPNKAQRYYEQALTHWRAALTENAKYVPAQIEFLDQMHQQADLYRESAAWSALRDTATKVINVDPKNADAYTYRAQANFQLLQNMTGTGSVAAGLKAVDADIELAMALNPDKPEPVVLKSVVLEYEAQDADARTLPQDAAKLRQSDQALLKGFLDKHPHNPEVSMRLAQFVGASGKFSDMAKMLREAYAANPGNAQLGEALAAIDDHYLGDHVEAEKVLKELAAAKPDSTDSYRRLAAFYQEWGRYDEAIQANKDVLSHLEPGGGVAMMKRTYNQLEALYNLAWINMDKAEPKGASSAEGKAALAEAIEWTDKYRADAPPRASVSLLDGRMHYLRDQISEAIVDLHSADVAFSLGNNKSPQWLQTKTLLGECFERQSDWGTALTYYDQILKADPTRVPIMLHRAWVLNKVARYSDAEAVVDRLKLEALPEGLQTYARTIKATALDAQGKTKESQEIFSKIKTPVAMLNMARSMAMDGDLESALGQINELLATSPDNEMALNMAIMINVELKHRDAAQKVLDIAIAKFPKNTQFQVMEAALKTKTGDSKEAQVEILKTIPDDYTRFITLAQFYRQLTEHETDPVVIRSDHESELASLENAYSKTDNSDANHENYALVVERIFNLSLEMGSTAANADDKTKYFDIAQKYVAVAERDNLDGVNGKLYEGRLEFLRDGSAKGIHTLEQAVAQRPDFSMGHTVLGRAYMEADQKDAALDQFHQAITQNPANLQALKMAIDILYKKMDSSRLPEAQALLKQAYMIAPHDRQLAAFNDVLGDPADAITVRENAYKNTPANQLETPEAMDNTRRLAMLYVRQADLEKNADEKKKRIQQAIDLLRPMYDKNPDDLEAADVLARLYMQTDQNNNALTMYERFLSSKDESVRLDAMLLLGDMYHSMGSDDQAVSTYLEAIKKQKPGNDQAERRLADLYFETNDMANAEAYYQKIYNGEQVKDMGVLRRLAESLVRQGKQHPEKYAAADDLFNTLFKSNPKDPEGTVLQGFSFFQQNKQEQAIANFNKILNDPATAGSNSPYRMEALYYRAFARFAVQQDLDQAIKDLELVRNESPGNLNARVLLAQVYRADHHYAEAANEYAQLLAIKPDFAYVRLQYAQFLYSLVQIQHQLSSDSQEDIAYVIRNVDPSDALQKILTDSETNHYEPQAEWLIIQGDLDALDGKANLSRQEYAAAFKLSDGNLPALANSAPAYLNSLLQTKNYDDVISIATNVIAQLPKFPDTYIKRAAAYAGKNKMTEASADISQAISLSAGNPAEAVEAARQSAVAIPVDAVIGLLQKRLDSNTGEVGTRVALAQLLVGANQPGEAVKVVAPLCADASLSPDMKLLALRISALGKYESKDYAGAQADYDALLKENPNDIESLNNLAFMLADDLKRPKDGLPYAERALKIVGSTVNSLNLSATGNVLDTHGWVEYLNGDAIGAISDLSRAVALAPMAVTYYHLASADQKAGRSDDAANAVSLGIKAAGKDDPVLPKLLALQKTVNGH